MAAKSCGQVGLVIADDHGAILGVMNGRMNPAATAKARRARKVTSNTRLDEGAAPVVGYCCRGGGRLRGAVLRVQRPSVRLRQQEADRAKQDERCRDGAWGGYHELPPGGTATCARLIKA